ncbi:hypothetical protein ACFGVS_00560 [Mucilaginibacter sp. AW1-7]|uniref:hypothetical protein n=1 Tax=Mucilaginibacter sp. AW1-7 TaxID=3349874 RepID=UPI003F7396C5
MQSEGFDIKELPTASETIGSLADVFERNVPPVKISEPDTWQFGKKLGVLRKGSKVKVLQTVTLEGDNYWAQVVRF